MLMTDDEITEMALLAKTNGIEVSLFARPNAAWDTGAMAVSSGGRTVGPRLRGQEQLVQCLEDVKRAASLGIRSVLLADEGALWVADEMRKQGELPADLQFKISVMMASANPTSIRLMEKLGADTFNIPTDLTLAQIAAIRQAVDIPLDIYVEAPDDLGGFVRLYEIPELVRSLLPSTSNLACAMPLIFIPRERISTHLPFHSRVSVCGVQRSAWISCNDTIQRL